MTRTKLLAAFAGMVAALATSAAPAVAEFQSNSTATKGTITVGAITIEGGGATLTCTSAEGTWTILSGGVPATQGKNQQLAFEKYTGCTAKSSLIKNVAATVGACTLELEQEAGKSTAVGSVVNACTVEVKILGTCIITLEAGQHGLVENNLENVGSDLVITANDAGIKSKPNAACLGVKGTSEAKEKATVKGGTVEWA